MPLNIFVMLKAVLKDNDEDNEGGMEEKVNDSLYSIFMNCLIHGLIFFTTLFFRR